MTRDVVVTGLGLVSCRGEGVAAHLAALDSGTAPATDTERFAPYAVHPAPGIAWDGQIPKKSDQRQMEAWQRLGVYAAGLALDAAGVKDDAAFKQDLHLVVSAGGGERDYAVDGAILTGCAGRRIPAPTSTSGCRTTCARPCSWPSSRTCSPATSPSCTGSRGRPAPSWARNPPASMRWRIGAARVAAGQIDAVLVGGSYNAERPDVLVIHEMGGYLRRGAYAPVFARAETPGFILGSCAAFLLLESAEGAAARGARALARLAPVTSDLTRREPGRVGLSLAGLWSAAGIALPDAVVSGARPASPRSPPRRPRFSPASPRARPSTRWETSPATGSRSPRPSVAALAAALVAERGLREVAVTAVGHRRGEGVLRVLAA